MQYHIRKLTPVSNVHPPAELLLANLDQLGLPASYDGQYLKLNDRWYQVTKLVPGIDFEGACNFGGEFLAAGLVDMLIITDLDPETRQPVNPVLLRLDTANLQTEIRSLENITASTRTLLRNNQFPNDPEAIIAGSVYIASIHSCRYYQKSKDSSVIRTNNQWQRLADRDTTTCLANGFDGIIYEITMIGVVE